MNRERILREAEAGTEILAASEVGTEIRDLIERAKPLTKSVLIDGVWFSFSGPTNKLEKYPLFTHPLTLPPSTFFSSIWCGGRSDVRCQVKSAKLVKGVT